MSRHPKALPYLFLTEMWERFGFYTVQGVLVLYMTKSFGFTDDRSYTIAGLFASLAYIAPMVGGFIADRLLGFRLSVIFGGIFLSLGYATLATLSTPLFYPGLAIVIVGNGLFKPNISSLLGALYKPGDTARESGFTLFYMGINIGVLLSGLSGTIQHYFGWHVVFAVASVGLLVGLFIFFTGIKWGEIHYSTDHLIKNSRPFLKKPWIILYCFFMVAVFSIILKDNILGKWLLPAVGVILVIFMFALAFRQEPFDRNRLLSLNVLIISSVVFWMLMFQLFFSVNLFIDRIIDKNIFGISIPTTWFYTLESVFVLLVGPMFAWAWSTLNRSQKNPSPFSKFILAIFFMGLGFFVLTLSTYFSDQNHLISPAWIVLSYFLITVGEMFISPTGLAVVTILSPQRLTGMMMGIWFAAIGFGGQFGGLLARISSIPDTVKDPSMQMPYYRTAFFDYTLIAFGVCIVLFFLQLIVRNALSRDE